MSGPKSLSPHTRRFPWKELPFNCPKVQTEQERNQRQRAQREDHYDSFKEDDHRRRTPSFSRDRSLGHQRPSNQEEFYRRRLSPPRDGGGGRGEEWRGSGEERGEGFSDESRMFKGRSKPASPLRLPRELLPPTAQHQSHRQQREAGTGWRREEPGRDHNSFRDPKPGPDPAEWSNVRRRNPPKTYREKHRGDGCQERSLPLKRSRRELEDEGQSRFRTHEEFKGRHHMQEEFKQRRVQNGWRAPPPLMVVEHDHRMAHGQPPSWSGTFPRGGREAEVDFGHRRGLHPSSQDRPRAPDGHHERRGGARENYQHDDNGERLRANSLGTGDHQDHQERAAHFSRGPDEPRDTYKNPARLQSLQHQRQRPPKEEQRRSSYDEPADLQSWEDERRSKPWRRQWPGKQQHQQPQRQQQLQLQLGGPELHTLMPRQNMQEWRREEEEEKMTGEDVTVVSKETLTIKVDMSRPVHSSSPLCYSSERQLSLDLVNVGRQRLDFLPMLEHSGSYQESSTRTGTFAQEIIALVHQVREQHFSSSELSLNQRFSGPQEGAPAAAVEPDELTLDQRFSSSRGFSFNMDSVLDDEEPLYSSASLQPVRGPSDLRHDLERRRMEKLEGVKVTICGNHVSQRPLGPMSDAAFEEPGELEQTENGGFSSWPGKHSRRGYSHMGTRRAAPYRRDAPHRPANGPQRRFGSRPGPMRRQNQRGHQSGPQW